MRSRNQGYQLIAVGKEKYVRMAVSCAASIRYFDQTRPIQLIVNQENLCLITDHLHLFDDITLIEMSDLKYKGPLIKLCMSDLAIYESSMFVDADCLLLNDKIDQIWQELDANYEVSVPGNWVSKGVWYEMQIAEMCKMFSVDKIVQMNSGVFFHKRTNLARKFFKTCFELYESHGNFVNHIHKGEGAPDEPFLAVAFGKYKIEPFRIRNEKNEAWMISTINSKAHRFDPRHNDSFLVKGNHDTYPTICHFINLRPHEEYQRLADFFMNESNQAK